MSSASRWFGDVKTALPRIALLSLSGHLCAATFVVDTTNPTGVGACTTAPNDCSLSGAILRANADSLEDLITFNIPTSDPGYMPAAAGVQDFWRIVPSGPSPSLPEITAPLTIDGYTQPGAIANTNTPDQGGLNGILKIEIDASIGSFTGAPLQVSARLTIRGLVINNTPTNNPRDAIQLVSTADGSILEGNYLGTDITGRMARGMKDGLSLNSGCCGDPLADIRVGGLLPAQRNLIAGNLDHGISAFSSPLIQGNLIGTDRTGLRPLSNGNGSLAGGGMGILVTTGCNIPSVIDPIIGGVNPNARNIIAANTGGGITISVLGGGCPNVGSATILGNYIGVGVDGQTPLGNGNHAIDVGVIPSTTNPLEIGDGSAAGANLIGHTSVGGSSGAGINLRRRATQIRNNRYVANSGLSRKLPVSNSTRTANDLGDADGQIAPGLGLQNFPDISAFSIAGNSLSLTYRVETNAANASFPLRVEFYKAIGDEGEVLLGTDSYTTALASKTINLAIPNGVSLSTDDVIIASAEDASGDGSEFSFQALSMVIDTPVPSACSGNVRIFCDAFESDPQRSIEVTVRASSSVFKPNGVVRLSDNRGATCTLNLLPTTTALTSSGRCVLAGSGAPGPITITAVYDTFSGAFGDIATGGNITQSASFVVPSN
jgi:hypothetical protein